MFTSHLTSTMSAQQVGTRKDSHAHSWYEGDPEQLSSTLDEFLADVPNDIEGKALPIKGARTIIAPYAQSVCMHNKSTMLY